ncbi:MAG: hypothetical protein WCC26_20535 [Terracidiphilus sp.]
MNIEDFAGCWMALDAFGDLDHPARFRQIVGAGRKEEEFFRHFPASKPKRLTRDSQLK